MLYWTLIPGGLYNLKKQKKWASKLKNENVYYSTNLLYYFIVELPFSDTYIFLIYSNNMYLVLYLFSYIYTSWWHFKKPAMNGIMVAATSLLNQTICSTHLLLM